MVVIFIFLEETGASAVERRASVREMLSARAAGLQLLIWLQQKMSQLSFDFSQFSYWFSQFEILLVWEKKKIVTSFHTDLFQNLKHRFQAKVLAN